MEHRDWWNEESLRDVLLRASFVDLTRVSDEVLAGWIASAELLQQHPLDTRDKVNARSFLAKAEREVRRRRELG